MKKNIDDCLGRFFKSFPDETFVIGFSGGPDSLALFLSAKEASKKYNIKLVLAHIDHGWREESKSEAVQLESFAKEMEVPFFLKTLKKGDFSGNLEESGRLKRLEFFKEVVKLNSAKAVLLGHHSDDASENLLKKLLEGGQLYSLNTLKEFTIINDVLVVRPLLNFTKESIYSYLTGRHFVQDESNFTSQFLRGRLRQEVMPFLTEKMGKNVAASLNSLKKQSEELESFIEESLKNFLIVEGVFGFYIEFKKIPHVFVLKGIIYKVCRQFSLKISKEDIASLAEAIIFNKSSFTKFAKDCINEKRRLIADRGVLFILNAKLPELSHWQLSYESDDGVEMGWRAAFQGKVASYVPNLGLKLDQQSDLKRSQVFDKWWTANKVPAFMRGLIPVIIENGLAVTEFLAGRQKNPLQSQIKVVLEYCTSKKSVIE